MALFFDVDSAFDRGFPKFLPETFFFYAYISKAYNFTELLI